MTETRKRLFQAVTICYPAGQTSGAGSSDPPYDRCERAHLRTVRRPRGITVEVCGERRQHAAAGGSGSGLCTRENRARRTDAIRREALRALQLIDIRARDDKARGPGKALLIPHVLICELHELRGVDLVLGEHRAGLQLEDVEPARDFGAVDVAVVPVRRP